MQKDNDLVIQAVSLVEKAKASGVVLRLLGATAIRAHCPRFALLGDSLNRQLTDVDVVAYRSQSREASSLFSELGFRPGSAFLMMIGPGRQIYEKDGLKVDVFFDKLEMNHTIDFRGRLELDFPTVSLADLLLAKGQIVNINEKDLKDLALLLREHDVGDGSREEFQLPHISDALSKEWGFYYTLTSNLGRLKDYAGRVLSGEDFSDVAQKVDKLLRGIEETPKTTGWKLRAKIGTARKWYRDVGEVVR